MKFNIGAVYIHIEYNEPFVIDGIRPTGVEGRLCLGVKWKPWFIEGRPEDSLRPISDIERKRRKNLVPPKRPV